MMGVHDAQYIAKFQPKGSMKEWTLCDRSSGHTIFLLVCEEHTPDTIPEDWSLVCIDPAKGERSCDLCGAGVNDG
jgi:hypothetical protein